MSAGTLKLTNGSTAVTGTTIRYSGFLVRWTGSNFQYVWVRQYQSTFANIYNGRGGVSIPLTSLTDK